MKLIDKAAVVAEIDDWQDKIIKGIGTIPLKGRQRADAALEYEILGFVRDFIDTLEVKEVDLEKELKEDWLFADKTEVDCLESMCLTEDMFVSLAKKYFQLGMSVSNKAQKGE